MTDHTPPLHDHLKAHQFKLMMSESGEVKMFYKEWSSDPAWLPQGGLSMLAHARGTQMPAGCPNLLSPVYKREDLDKLKSTISKVKGYLRSSNSLEWWTSWLDKASSFVEQYETSVKSQGMCMTYFGVSFNSVCILFLCSQMVCGLPPKNTTPQYKCVCEHAIK